MARHGRRQEGMDLGFEFTCKGCTEAVTFCEISGRSDADGGRHEGDGCRTAI